MPRVIAALADLSPPPARLFQTRLGPSPPLPSGLAPAPGSWPATAESRWAARTAPASGQLAFREEPGDTARPAFDTTDLPTNVPSEGSALHCIGECKPCMWFWKPQGCQNDRECRHCHLCPQSEAKARKRAAHKRQQLQGSP